MKRTSNQKDKVARRPASISQPRELAEEVRSHLLQVRACAPEVSAAQVQSDALNFAARDNGMNANDMETCILSWARAALEDTASPTYDQALASWFLGDTVRASEMAAAAAGEAAESARQSASTAGRVAAAYYNSAGTNGGGTERARQAMDTARSAAGDERKAWMLTGQVEYHAGHLPEALQAYRRALAAALGEGDPLAWAEAANQVAWILDELGQHLEAEPLLRSVVRIMEQTSGASGPEVAAALNNLGGVVRATGRAEEAEMLYRRALTIAENAFGERHPQVAIALNNLAGVLRSTRRLAEAEPLFRRALEIDESTLGSEHPSVALYLNNLASLLHDMERLEEAAPLLRRALEIDEKHHGQDHPSVLNDLDNLAFVLRAMNRHSEAEPLLRRSLELTEKRHGPDHHRVADGLTQLSLLLCEMNRPGEAGPLSRRAMKTTLAFARRKGRAAPGTRFVGRAYCQWLKLIGIPDDEVQSMLFMMKSELERESTGLAGRSSPLWLEAVMEEMGIAYDPAEAGA